MQPELTSEPPEPRTSHVRQVLEDAAKDLDNAELPLAFIANPVRDLLLKPTLGFARDVLPIVTGVVPFADDITALGLSLPFNAMRFGYNLAHPDEKSSSILQDAEEAIRDLTDIKKIEKSIEPSARERAELLTLKAGFISNTIEIISDPSSRLSDWNESSERLAAYLENVGLGDEFRREMLNPRFNVNYRILGHVQKASDNELVRRQKTFLSSAPKLTSIHEIAKLMRYSTAAFGKEFMDAQNVLAGKENGPTKKSDTLVGSEALKMRVCEHVGIPIDSISYFCMGPGGSMKLLRHFISIDAELQAVVLAIRGTGSISGWVIDFQGMGRPFCNGIAHSGMADMADAILANSKEAVLKALQDNPNYRLLITGESLGGGVTPLVNLLFHNDKDFSKFMIKAHPFAGPPVYYQTSLNPNVDKAIKNCTAYIHRDDIVAHVSVNAVQRLLAKLCAIDEVTKRMSLIDRQLVAAGRKPATQPLTNAALTGDANVRTLDGAPKLVMPASSIIWFCEQQQPREEEGSCKYNMMVCNPVNVADLGIPVTTNAFADHPPHVYETILNEVEQTGWEIIAPPRFKDLGDSAAAFV